MQALFSSQLFVLFVEELRLVVLFLCKQLLFLFIALVNPSIVSSALHPEVHLGEHDLPVVSSLVEEVLVGTHRIEDLSLLPLGYRSS